VWTGEYDLNTLRVDGEIFESATKKLRIRKYPYTCGQGLRNKHDATNVAKTCWQGMEYKNKIMKFSSRTLICVLADLFYFFYEKPVPPFCGFYHSKNLSFVQYQ